MTTLTELPPTTADTKPTCPVCGATSGLRRLNDIAPALETPSVADDYYACSDGEACISQAMKNAADLIRPDLAGTSTDAPGD